jgi:hypothetical protein
MRFAKAEVTTLFLDLTVMLASGQGGEVVASPTVRVFL